MTNPRPLHAAALFHLAVLALALPGLGCGKSGGKVDGAAATPGSGDGPDVTYGVDLFVLALGEVLAPEVPTVSGGVTGWAVDPALPTGLTLDALTGALSGTPTERAPLTRYAISATNSAGTTVVPVHLRVLGESRFVYGASAVDGSVAAFGVEGPSGALFHQGWIGASTTGADDLAADPFGRFLCAVDEFDLVSYLVDPATGQLTLGDSATLGSGPHSLVVHPGGEYVIACSRGSDRVRSFAIDPVTGALTLVVERFTGLQPEDVVVDPLGRFAVVRHAYDATPGSEKTLLGSYLFDAESGDMVTSSSFDLLLSDATAMTMALDGEHLYLTLSAPFPTVLVCAIDTATGKPSLVTTADAGTTPVALEVSPRGTRLYVVNQGSDDVTLFDIDADAGTLTATSSIPSSPGGDALSFSDDGAELYLVDSAARSLTAHLLDPLNGLSTASSTVRTRAGSGALVHVAGSTPIARRATDLYVASTDSDDLVAYSISASTGELDDGGLPPLAAGDAPAGLVVDPLGRFVYVSCTDSNEVIGYGVQPDGSLVDLMLPTAFAAGDPAHMAIDLAGQYIYVTVDFFDLLVAYRIQTDGSLVVHDSRPLADLPSAIAVDPTGSFVFVTHSGNGSSELGEVAVYAINAQNGNLTELPTIPAPGHPASIAFDPSGTRAYVTFRDTDRVQPYDLGTGGTLTAIGGGSITQNEPGQIELTRDGRFAFATFEDTASQGGLLLYDVNATTGELFNADNLALQWRDSVAAGTGPRRLAITPDGAHVYVLAAGSNEVRAFDSDPLTGLTTPLETEVPGLAPVGMGLRVVVE